MPRRVVWGLIRRVWGKRAEIAVTMDLKSTEKKSRKLGGGFNEEKRLRGARGEKRLVSWEGINWGKKKEYRRLLS